MREEAWSQRLAKVFLGADKRSGRCGRLGKSLYTAHKSPLLAESNCYNAASLPGNSYLETHPLATKTEPNVGNPKEPESKTPGQVPPAHSGVPSATGTEHDGTDPKLPELKPQAPVLKQQGTGPVAVPHVTDSKPNSTSRVKRLREGLLEHLRRVAKGSVVPHVTDAKGSKPDDSTPLVERRTAGFLELLRKVAEGSVVLGALLFVAGWSYLYGYYTTFGISLGDIDFSAEVILAFSFPVVFSRLGSLLIVLLAVIYQLSRKYLARWHKLIIPLLVLLFGVSTWGVSRIGVQRGIDAARRDMLRRSSLLPTVAKLVLSSEAADKTALCEGTNDPLVLLLHTHESYFFVEPLGLASESINPKNLTLCVVPQERVRFILLEVRVQEDK